MSAPTRLEAAPSKPQQRAIDAWQRATEIRREWLTIGLATAPADRPATEAIITRLYARHHRTRPQFVWVPSPHAAAPLVATHPTHADLHQWVMAPPYPARPPIASDIAADLSRLRSALDEAYERPDFDVKPPKRKDGDPPRTFPRSPLPALAAGLSYREVARQGVREALETSLLCHIVHPIRTNTIAWYGQQDAGWIALYDVFRRLGLAHYQHADAAALDDWAALAGASGWWWPAEDVCVLADRPAVLEVTADPHGWHDEVRLNRLVYRDGWSPS